jgi:hypothetical protein
MTMRVLVVGSVPVSAQSATDELEAAGHEVLRCHEESGPAFPCAALANGGGCPLEGEPVDVVLDVHDARTTAPSAYEDGVACAIRQHVPIVVVADGTHPYERWSTSHVSSATDVTRACESAATSPLPEHSDLATRVAADSLERAGVTARGATATVHRDRGSLKVLLSLPPAHPEGLEQMVVARVITALRRHDRAARGIDVTMV